jgi:hypothetical protein
VTSSATTRSISCPPARTTSSPPSSRFDWPQRAQPQPGPADGERGPRRLDRRRGGELLGGLGDQAGPQCGDGRRRGVAVLNLPVVVGGQASAGVGAFGGGGGVGVGGLGGELQPLHLGQPFAEGRGGVLVRGRGAVGGLQVGPQAHDPVGELLAAAHHAVEGGESPLQVGHELGGPRNRRGAVAQRGTRPSAGREVAEVLGVDGVEQGHVACPQRHGRGGAAERGDQRRRGCEVRLRDFDALLDPQGAPQGPIDRAVEDLPHPLVRLAAGELLGSRAGDAQDGLPVTVERLR